MLARIVISILIAVIVFLAVLFILNPILPGIGVYAGIVGFLSGLGYFLGYPHLTRRF